MALIARGDIPLSEDPSARYLPWLLGIMCYFAVLATVGAVTSHRLAARWDFALASVVTVQIPAADPDVDDTRKMEQAIRMMRGLPDLSRLQRVDPAESADLLAPWIGPDLVRDLPLPRLFDLHFAQSPAAALPQFEKRLAELYPGVTVDAHSRWMGHVARLTRAVEAMGLTVLVLVMGASVIAVIFAVRTSVSIHREVISILHLIGARDGYIASEFQAHVLKMALRGGAVGALLALGTLAAMSALLDPSAARSPGLLGAVVGGLPADAVEWALIVAAPLLVAFVAWIAARFSVLGALRKLNP
ncbi:hypothetical protein NUH88_12210 [Nisaea acidiphila]|uniref:Cell division protein n=1 Tax=Nisaea acidiphila TaxID=1862145 RepID=A0A9J7AKI7_9PROT|nr:hypothetical protein [Nisaea acidiphila]UUX48179.1 hypothetical protein NUH88_12210 [Nisaea acidiphila]